MMQPKQSTPGDDSRHAACYTGHNVACKLTWHGMVGNEYDKFKDRPMQRRSQQDNSSQMHLARPPNSYRCIMQWLGVTELTAASADASSVAVASRAITSAPVLHAMMSSGVACLGGKLGSLL